MRFPSAREVATEAKLLLIGVTTLIWTRRLCISVMKRLSR
jgi:hypothetical protein